MKIQIRQSVFETNSSSTHALCLSLGGKLDQKPANLEIKTGEFGWEFARLKSPRQKASYLFTALYGTDRLELLEFIKQTLTANGVAWEIIFPSGVLDSYGTRWIDCFIDHGDQAVDMVDAICKDADSLMRYLFSTESFILTGSDNDARGVVVDVPYAHECVMKSN